MSAFARHRALPAARSGASVRARGGALARARTRGLSLIELLIFIGIVSVALVALLRVFVQTTAASADFGRLDSTLENGRRMSIATPVMNPDHLVVAPAR